MSSSAVTPFFSIVIPVLDGGRAFETSLQSIARSSFGDVELIVVDDGSTDGSADLARIHGAVVLNTSGKVGPAAARNLGAARASGRHLFFLDADCELHSTALELAARRLAGDPGLDAVFGSYDDSPAAPGWISQLKNLHHHFVHRANAGPISTFWSGCGAMRRSTFLSHGGYDAGRFPRPSIEDIELGYRIHDAGGRIELDPEIQVKHWKSWTLARLVRTDLVDRGIPWMRLVCRRRAATPELNLAWRPRACVAAMSLAGAAFAFSPAVPELALAVPAATLTVAALEHRFLRFVSRRKGPTFALGAIAFLSLHYLVAGAAAVLGLALHGVRDQPVAGAIPDAVHAGPRDLRSVRP